MKFVDLFAGLGGFHLALSGLGHQCVFACEKNESLRDLYKLNFGMEPAGDLRDVDPQQVPEHEILCAGFPCQPFSKAGEQLGFDCPINGDLFAFLLNVVKHRTPEFLILENVPNLEWHNNGDTIVEVADQLEKLGYEVDYKKLSPHLYGVPQIRERIFIVGSRRGLGGFSWPVPETALTSVKSVLDSPQLAKSLSTQVKDCFRVWQQFLNEFPSEEELPSFPIWSMEFGANYPFEECTPYSLSEKELRGFRGSFGVSLSGMTFDEIMAAIPPYARTKSKRFPRWKIAFIRQNRDLYRRQKMWLNRWIPEIVPFPPSYQKLEWNCKGGIRKLDRYILQLRASGVRVKRPTTAPSLVAMTTSQVPIVGWEGRYMTARECARLQSMDDLAYLPPTDNLAYKALGNAVNVEVVRRIAQELLSRKVVPSTMAHSRPARVKQLSML